MSISSFSLLSLPLVLASTLGACAMDAEPARDDSKSDTFGNETLGEPCSFDFECSADEGLVCGEESVCIAVDPWAMAKDVSMHNVPFGAQTPIPEQYRSPEGIAPVSLSSPEWWQRWPGGFTQSFAWSKGTDFGKRCGVASAIRLQAIMEHVDQDGGIPGFEAFHRLLDETGWGGTMYNWTEDVSESTGSAGSFRSGSMWAWRTGAIKFINVVHDDGSCDLPTLELVETFAEKCIANATDGEIQGCRVSI